MVSKTHVDLREAGRIANIIAIAIHFLFVFLGPLVLVYYPFIAINLIAHICFIYGNSRYKLGLMLMTLFWWFIPAFVSIVYVISSVVFPTLYANTYLIICACLFLGFYIVCILATDSTSTADKIGHSNDLQLNVSYTTAEENITY